MEVNYEKCQEIAAVDVNDNPKLASPVLPLVHAIKRQILVLAKDGSVPSFLEIGPTYAVASRLLMLSYPKSVVAVTQREHRVAQLFREKFPKLYLVVDDPLDMKFKTDVTVVHHRQLLNEYSYSKAAMILKDQMKICQAIVFSAIGCPASPDGTGWKNMVVDAGLRLSEYGEFNNEDGKVEAYISCTH